MRVMGEEEFDTFFAVSYSRLVGQLYATTGDWAAAREIVLEAFVRAWDHRAQFDLEVAPDSWIRTVAWSLAGSRKHGTEGEIGGGPAGFVERVRGLGEDERRFVVLRYLCDLGVQDIAAEAGVSVEAVAVGLARGRAVLGAPKRIAELVEELYDFVNQQAHPRLAAPRVRALGERRRLGRRSATVGGIGVLALAGVLVVAFLAGSPRSPTVAPSAGHPTGVHRVTAGGSPS